MLTAYGGYLSTFAFRTHTPNLALGEKEIKQSNNVEFIGVGQINVNFVFNLQRTRP